MKIENLKTVEEISIFLDGTESVAFTIIDSKQERYERVQKVLLGIKYSSLSKHEKGIVIRFICKISGYSRQQVTRLIHQCVNSGKLTLKQRTYNGFKKLYSREDIHLLARTDEMHIVTNGAAIKKYAKGHI